MKGNIIRERLWQFHRNVGMFMLVVQSKSRNFVIVVHMSSEARTDGRVDL